MSKIRTTQHRPARDEQKAKELADLKRENQQLKKQIGRLRKQITKLVEIYGLDIQVEPENASAEQPAEVAPEQSSSTVKCERCGNEELVELPVGTKVFLICNNKACLWRKALPAKSGPEVIEE